GGAKGELDINRLLNKRASITATSLRGRPPAQKAAIALRVATAVWPLYQCGALQYAPTKAFPLAQAADAHRLLESGTNVGKIVLTTESGG
ncbi:MAG: zinc-binding dehydrogenase, partial [Propionibacteriaceae bacterium]|nr:zinc-binding dehydrogenase [Propionibacteriaceae bacterium]